MRKGRKQHSIDLPNGNRICSICKEEKPLDKYHKHKEGAKGHYSYCGACRGDYQYQRRLENHAKNKTMAVAECESCERLMKKQFEIKNCTRCRKELGIRTRDLAKAKDWSYRY